MIEYDQPETDLGKTAAAANHVGRQVDDIFYTCEACHDPFKRKSHLTAHQKTCGKYHVLQQKDLYANAQNASFLSPASPTREQDSGIPQAEDVSFKSPKFLQPNKAKLVHQDSTFPTQISKSTQKKQYKPELNMPSSKKNKYESARLCEEKDKSSEEDESISLQIDESGSSSDDDPFQGDYRNENLPPVIQETDEEERIRMDKFAPEMKMMQQFREEKKNDAFARIGKELKEKCKNTGVVLVPPTIEEFKIMPGPIGIPDEYKKYFFSFSDKKFTDRKFFYQVYVKRINEPEFTMLPIGTIENQSGSYKKSSIDRPFPFYDKINDKYVFTLVFYVSCELSNIKVQVLYMKKNVETIYSIAPTIESD